MIPGVASGRALQDQFLNLLVTQLRYQDPIEPVKQENFIGQLAQFSVVEGVEKLNTRFSDLLYAQQITGGFGLVDRDVSYQLPGETELRRGHVDTVFVQDGVINLGIGKTTIPISQVVGVFAS
jgi:flagellar basal-body rod modification protein FlgD